VEELLCLPLLNRDYLPWTSLLHLSSLRWTLHLVRNFSSYPPPFITTLLACFRPIPIPCPFPFLHSYEPLNWNLLRALYTDEIVLHRFIRRFPSVITFRRPFIFNLQLTIQLRFSSWSTSLKRSFTTRNASISSPIRTIPKRVLSRWFPSSRWLPISTKSISINNDRGFTESDIWSEWNESDGENSSGSGSGTGSGTSECFGGFGSTTAT